MFIILKVETLKLSVFQVVKLIWVAITAIKRLLSTYYVYTRHCTQCFTCMLLIYLQYLNHSWFLLFWLPVNSHNQREVKVTDFFPLDL